MNKNIADNLDKVAKNLQLLTDFCSKYDLPEGSFIYGFDDVPSFSLDDAIAADKLFGKAGWTRTRDRYQEKITYDWNRVIDGVKINIRHAEVQEDMNDTPVSPKAFPIQLEESTVVGTAILDDEPLF